MYNSETKYKSISTIFQDKEFYEYSVPADGDCAIHCLAKATGKPITRSSMAHTLLAHKDEHTVRRIAYHEIKTAFISDDAPFQMKTDIWRELYDRYIQKQQHHYEKSTRAKNEVRNLYKTSRTAFHYIEALMPEHRNFFTLKNSEDYWEVYDDYKLMGLFDAIDFTAFDPENTSGSFVEEYHISFYEMQSLENELNHFCQDEEQYCNFIHHFLAIPYTWLTYALREEEDDSITSFIDAYCYIENIDLYIWEKDESQRRNVKLLHHLDIRKYKQLNENEVKIAHLLHIKDSAGCYFHFNLLSEKRILSIPTIPHLSLSNPTHPFYNSLIHPHLRKHSSPSAKQYDPNQGNFLRPQSSLEPLRESTLHVLTNAIVEGRWTPVNDKEEETIMHIFVLKKQFRQIHDSSEPHHVIYYYTKKALEALKTAVISNKLIKMHQKFLEEARREAVEYCYAEASTFKHFADKETILESLQMGATLKVKYENNTYRLFVKLGSRNYQYDISPKQELHDDTSMKKTAEIINLTLTCISLYEYTHKTLLNVQQRNQVVQKFLLKFLSQEDILATSFASKHSLNYQERLLLEDAWQSYFGSAINSALLRYYQGGYEVVVDTMKNETSLVVEVEAEPVEFLRSVKNFALSQPDTSHHSLHQENSQDCTESAVKEEEEGDLSENTQETEKEKLPEHNFYF